MRDINDPGTLELLPPKRGRPCLDNEQGPLTAAQRQARYRQGKAKDLRLLSSVAVRETAYVRQQSDSDILAILRKDMAFLDYIAGSHPAKRGNKSGIARRVAALVAELARRYPQT